MKDDGIIKLGVLFYICSILGYFYELIYNYLVCHKIFSHGFLKGLWLPIYGMGSLLIMSLYKFKNNPLKIFIYSFFLTGILEGLSGYGLLKIFKIRLWDYTGRFLNISGFVCFLSSFCFGIGGLLVIYLLYPLVLKIVKNIDRKKIINFLIIISVIFSSDLIASILK